MAPRTEVVLRQTPTQITTQAEEERSRSRENERTVKLIAQRFLGHIYDQEARQIGEMAVEEFQDENLMVDCPVSHYAATLDNAKETALARLNNHFGFNVTTPVGYTPFQIGAGLDVSRSNIQISDSSSVFCAVACVRKDRSQFQRMPNRLGVISDSNQLGIIKSLSVYTGYRVVLEIFSSKDTSEKKTTVGVQAEITKVLGGDIEFTHERRSLADRTIQQINIREIVSFGGYRVPPIEILDNNFQKIQRMFENIRKDFELSYYYIVDRYILIDPNVDLARFREIQAPRTTALPLSAHLEPLLPITQRDSAYYAALEGEIISSLPLSERNEIRACGGSLDLKRMLYALEKSFSHLIELPEEKDPCILLVGTDSSMIRLQGARLMGGEVLEHRMLFPNGDSKTVTKYRINGQVLSLDILPDVFDTSSNAISEVRAYGNIVEVPILTNRFSLPQEYNICLGASTAFAISHFAPQKIVICIPRDFFQFSNPEELVVKVRAHYDSLRSVVYNQTSQHTSKSILFLIDDLEEDETFANTLGENIASGIDALYDELIRIRKSKSPIGLVISYVNTLFSRAGAEISELEIREVIDAYMFIVGHLAFSSKTKLNNILTNTDSPRSFFYQEYKLVPKSKTREDTTFVLRSPYMLKRSEKIITLADLPSSEFDMDNISLNSDSSFRKVLRFARTYMRHIENNVRNLESQALNSLELLQSIDRILELFRKKEIEKIDKAEAEKVLGEAIKEEITGFSEKLKNVQKSISVNEQEIITKETEIKTWETDITPTPLILNSNKPIIMRSFWRLPPFGKEYTFQTSYKFSKCEFSNSPGSFHCIETEFMNTGRAVFTPKHYGHEADLRAKITIWIEKKEHPDTETDIENNKETVKELKAVSQNLKTKLEDINRSIHEFSARESDVLIKRKDEITLAFSRLNTELRESRSLLSRHSEYYEIVKRIYDIYNTARSQQRSEETNSSARSSKPSTNCYGLTPKLGSFISGPQYPLEKHKLIKDLSNQQRKPFYIITPGNQHDIGFGEEFPGEPRFYEYDGQGYSELIPSFGQNAKEVAQEIQKKISKEEED